MAINTSKFNAWEKYCYYVAKYLPTFWFWRGYKKEGYDSNFDEDKYLLKQMKQASWITIIVIVVIALSWILEFLW
jgi:hypothetical protein